MKRFTNWIKTKYRNMLLQSKLMLTYLIIISIPMILIALFFYGKVYNMLLSDTIRNEQEESAKTAPDIEAALDQVLSTNSAVQALPFYSEIFDINQAFSMDSIIKSPSADHFYGEISSILDDSIIQDVRIYMDLPSQNIDQLNEITNSPIFDSVSKINSSYWKGIFSGTGISTLHCPSFYLNNDEITNLGDIAYITKRAVHMDGVSYNCYIAYYYSSDIFLEILNNNLPNNGSVAYIINDRDAIISTTNAALSSTYYLNYAAIQDSFMSSNNFLKKNVLEEDIYAGMYNIKQSGWYMVVVIPSSPLIKKSNQIMIQYILLFLVCIVIALYIAISLSASITKRLAMVTKQMAKVRTGPPIPLKESNIHDEIGDLIDTYNYMSTEMNDLLKERAKSAEELRIAEFNSLQAQINPHFLYNTMDMINWMATQGRTDEITDVVQNLSRFYKLTLSKKETLSTISDEIEHASIYIRLQNMRFHDSITFVVDIPDELLEYQIPKLTLQPVIENAILHGIMEKQDKKGCIVLTGWLDADHIELLISDDGIGISKNDLEHILTGNGKSKRGNNIAIYNTHHRLQVLYGEEFGLSYQSTPGKGTDVSIKLPIRNKMKDFHRNDIIQISTSNTSLRNSSDVINPQTLLDYNEKISNDTYVLQNIHQISDKLPTEEPLYILTHDVTEDFPAHTHNYFEFTYCCRGSIINIIDEKELILSAGDAFLLNQNVVQEIKRMDSDALLINIVLRPELFETILKDFYETDTPLSKFFHLDPSFENNYIYFPLGHNIKLQTLLSCIIKEYTAAEYHMNEPINALLQNFFYLLANIKEYSYCGIDNRTFSILHLIQEHGLKESEDQISSRLSMTAEDLSDYLEKHTGQKLIDIIHEVKMGYALKLLQRSDTNIFDIMNACGYEDFEKFSEVFESIYDISPEVYRKDIL